MYTSFLSDVSCFIHVVIVNFSLVFLSLHSALFCLFVVSVYFSLSEVHITI